MKIENMATLRDTLERMETPQLDALLLEDLRKEAPNAELIRMISSILKERDRDLIPKSMPISRKPGNSINAKTSR